MMREIVTFLARAILLCAFILLVIGVGFRWGRSYSKVEVIHRVDTLYFAEPQLRRELASSVAEVRVPTFLFAPADTLMVVEKANVEGCDAGEGANDLEDVDSVDLRVEIARFEYRDSVYRAVVSGPRIGELRPRLEWIETYNLTTQHHSSPSSRWAVTLGPGLGFSQNGIVPFLGVSIGYVLWQR